MRVRGCRCIANVSKGADLCQIVFTKTRWANYAVGNYVFLNFPQISFWYATIIYSVCSCVLNLGRTAYDARLFVCDDREWHPFTLSSGPHDEFNEVHIKALGDFTGDLLRRVTSAALTQVACALACSLRRLTDQYSCLFFSHIR